VPALARIAAGTQPDGGRSVMLFDPPAALCGPALTQLGLDAQQLLVVHGREGVRATAGLRRLLPSADLLWALEQALKSGHVGVALAWLPPRVKADALRRLQLAAQAHDGPAFLFREVDARLKPSAAPLRLLLQSAGVDRCRCACSSAACAVGAPVADRIAPGAQRALRARARAEPAAGAVQRAEASSIAD
jgi:protein ImuA